MSGFNITRDRPAGRGNFSLNFDCLKSSTSLGTISCLPLKRAVNWCIVVRWWIAACVGIQTPCFVSLLWSLLTKVLISPRSNSLSLRITAESHHSQPRNLQDSLSLFNVMSSWRTEGARAALSLAGTMLGYYPVRVLPSKTAIVPVNPTFLPRVRIS